MRGLRNHQSRRKRKASIMLATGTSAYDNTLASVLSQIISPVSALTLDGGIIYASSTHGIDFGAISFFSTDKDTQSRMIQYKEKKSKAK
jgi:hypothetical protein